MNDYELWYAEENSSYILIESDRENKSDVLDPDSKLILTFSASSFDEALKKRDEFLEW